MIELAVILVTILGVIASIILNALVFAKLWAWFVVPFFGVKALTIPMAMGLSLMIKYLTYTHVPEKEYESQLDAVRVAFARIIGIPMFVLLIGWIISLFI